MTKKLQYQTQYDRKNVKPLTYIYKVDYFKETDSYCYTEEPHFITCLDEDGGVNVCPLDECGLLVDETEVLERNDFGVTYFLCLEDLKESFPQAITWEECNKIEI